MKNQIIVNSSITLIKLSNEHIEVIYNAINENRAFLIKWLPFIEFTKRISDTKVFVDTIVNDKEQKQTIYTLWYKNEFAGLLGIKDIDRFNHQTELGYWLIEKMTGKGIVTLSVKNIIHYCFENLDINRIQIKCGSGNHYSSAIPKRLGFKFEGIEREGEIHSWGHLDLEIYSLLRKEWNLEEKYES